MAVTVEFGDSLRARLGGAEDMEVAAGTVHSALIRVAQSYPSLHLFNCEGELRSILRLHKNGQPAAAAETLQDGDRLMLSLSA